MSALRTFIVRILLKIMWSVGGKADAIDGLPRLSSASIRPLLEALHPGDLVLLGNNGVLTHIAVHVGAGEVIHAMATEKTMRGWFGSMWDALRRLFGGTEQHVGVVREPLAGFVDRYERDTWVVVRSPADADGVARGLARIGSLVGKPYDYGFKVDNEAWYCTEVADAYLKAALGDRAPTLGTRAVSVPLLLRSDVVEPVAVLDAPGLAVVAANRAAVGNYRERLAGIEIS
ncbi:MAG: hypothetical protein ABMB14_15220 [Myxococcota bacterium]